MERKEKLKLYLETTIPNYKFADDTPRERDITKQFLQRVTRGDYRVFISELVTREIEKTSDLAKRKKLLDVVSGIAVLPITHESKELGKAYVSLGIIPPRYEPDGIHLAIATLNEMDVLVTWNMEHLANSETRISVREENLKRGLKVIDIATPEEVMASG
ncbi:MAG: type II toxin-antitoxin system VapC family toxin [bacterium]